MEMMSHSTMSSGNARITFSNVILTWFNRAHYDMVPQSSYDEVY